MAGDILQLTGAAERLRDAVVADASDVWLVHPRLVLQPNRTPHVVAARRLAAFILKSSYDWSEEAVAVGLGVTASTVRRAVSQQDEFTADEQALVERHCNQGRAA